MSPRRKDCACACKRRGRACGGRCFWPCLAGSGHNHLGMRMPMARRTLRLSGASCGSLSCRRMLSATESTICRAGKMSLSRDGFAKPERTAFATEKISRLGRGARRARNRNLGGHFKQKAGWQGGSWEASRGGWKRRSSWSGRRLSWWPYRHIRMQGQRRVDFIEALLQYLVLKEAHPLSERVYAGPSALMLQEIVAASGPPPPRGELGEPSALELGEASRGHANVQDNLMKMIPVPWHLATAEFA